jgi:putative addiction module component (TIGR02574 family)
LREEELMTQRAEQLLEEVLRLSEEERGDFAARLLESLDSGAEDGVDAAWAAEIQKRLQDLDSGQVKPIPLSEAWRMIQEDADDSGAP